MSTALPTVLRWTEKRKRDLVAAVARGETGAEEACCHYRISAEEFAGWQRAYPVQEPAR